MSVFRRLLNLILLQGVVLIYSINTIVGKYASMQEFMSLRFIGFLCLEVAVLGVYAICWQQVIKRFELSVAYANKAMGILWSLLFGVFLFHERVTPGKLAGIALVIVGIILINGAQTGEETA